MRLDRRAQLTNSTVVKLNHSLKQQKTQRLKPGNKNLYQNFMEETHADCVEERLVLVE